MISQTYLKQGAHPYPHIGNMIRKKLFDLHISTAEAARRLGVKTSTVHAYYKQPSVQFGIIWKLSIAVDHDFLSDIMAYYPENFPVKVNEKMVQMEQELKILRDLLRKWFWVVIKYDCTVSRWEKNIKKRLKKIAIRRSQNLPNFDSTFMIFTINF